MEKQPSIALIMSNLEIGGTQRVMLHLADGLLKEGIIVDIVAVRAQGPFNKIVPAEVNLVDLRAKRALFAIPALIRYLRKNRPDAVLSGLTHINIAAIISRSFSGISTRLIVSERNNLTQKKIHKPKLWDRFLYAVVNLFYPLADGIITVSKDVADDLARSAKLNPEKIIPIHNPIPVDEVRKFSTEKISHPWLSDDVAALILAVGRLHRQKDYPTLIKAFNVFRQRKPARLMIIGEGKERPKLEKIINASPYSEDICLMGKIDNPFPFMARADVFVLSSEWEGFGNVLVEALACGATVVSTDCHSGPREILEDNKYGLLVPVGDADGLADAIERSLSHPFPAKQGIARARDFSVEKAVALYIKVLLPGFNPELEDH